MTRRRIIHLLTAMRLAGGGLTFLLRDDFLTDASAPLASPRTAEPGPGTLTFVDTASQLSIAGGEIVPSAQTAGALDPLIHMAGYARQAGRVFTARVKRVSAFAGNDASPQMGWATAAGGGISTYTGLIFVASSMNILRYSATSTATGIVAASDAFYNFHFILRSTGSFVIVGNTLEWVENAGSNATMYPAIAASAASRMPAGVDTFRILDLPAPFNSDFGLATQRLAGSVAAGTTFVHEANCVIEWVQTTLPSAGNTTRLWFRKQDSSNLWRVLIENSGNISLDEIVAGTVTIRGSAAGVLSNGHRVVVVADGSTIRVYSNNVLRITYSSASNFAAATVGELNLLAGGSVVSDIVSWPRTLPAYAASLLDKAVA